MKYPCKVRYYPGINSTLIDRPIIAQQRELGDFLRMQRQRLAQLSGLSTTWYTGIEQGRNVSMASLALSRLAAALRLARAERAYLFELAGKRDSEQPEDATDDVTPAMCACVDAIGTPVYVLDRIYSPVGK